MGCKSLSDERGNRCHSIMAPRSALHLTAAAVAAASISTACLHTEQAAPPRGATPSSSEPGALNPAASEPVTTASPGGSVSLGVDGGRLQHELLAIDPQARAYRV